MLSGRIRRRALALLGALLLVILVWPPCCATMPKPLPAVRPLAPWEVVPASRSHPTVPVLPVPLHPYGSVGTSSSGTNLKRHGSSSQAADQEQGDQSEASPQEPGERQQQHQQHQHQQEPPDADSRKSRRVSEFYRFMRVLNQSVEPNERRQIEVKTPAGGTATVRGRVDSGVEVQLNIPSRENSPPRTRDYLIEPIDKNKSQPTNARTRLVSSPYVASHSLSQPPRQQTVYGGFSDKAAAAGDSSPHRVTASSDATRTEFDDTRGSENGAASSQPSPVLSRSKRGTAPASANPHRHQHKLPPGGPANGTAGVWHGRRGAGDGSGRHHQQQPLRSNNESNLERNERSANLSHLSGATRKIQLFIKNRYVQLLPDGTVNGTNDDLSDYTILQRTTVGIGQIKIQAVATCLFLCMDTCGSVYGSKQFTDDCIFNEQMEQHHYNTYSSTPHSNARRTLYLALNKTGQPRKIQIPVNRTLGKLATYTKALTQTVAHDRVEQLISRLFGPNHVRHGVSQLCETGQPLEELTAKEMRSRPACGGQGKGPLAAASGTNGGGGKRQQQAQPNATGKDEKEGPRQKKKKKRRKCREDEAPGEHCFRPGQGAGAGAGVGGTNSGKKKGGQHQGQPRGGSSISSGSSGSSSSVGSSSTGSSNQSPVSLSGNVSGSSNSISNSGSNSSANSLIASISSGGPNRQGLPYAQLTATPNARKPKPTRKLLAGGGNRNGSQQAGSGGQGSGQGHNGQIRKPKKPTQQQQPAGPAGTGPGGKRNGTGGNQSGKPGPARSKLVAAGIVPPKANPKPASLTIARTARPVTPFPSTSPTTMVTAATTTASVSTTPETTPPNAPQDTSQQSEDTELEMDDVLQQSAEFTDDLDDLDEGSPTASSWHELFPTSSVSEQRSRYKALSCCSYLSLSSLVVYGATVHLLYL